MEVDNLKGWGGGGMTVEVRDSCGGLSMAQLDFLSLPSSSLIFPEPAVLTCVPYSLSRAIGRRDEE